MKHLKKALVFGAEGQLGHAIFEELERRDIEAIALGRKDVDIQDAQQVRHALATHKPSVVFNGAAYNAVDKAEKEEERALKLNALAPGIIAAACFERGASLMHFSTDYVFGDGFDQPINEGHAPSPLSAYARSKRLGEVLALQNNPRTYVVRCCGLYDHRRHNFIRTMLRHGLQNKPLRVVDDQYVSPTWVEPLAKVCVNLIEHGNQVYGVCHAVSHGSCSWYKYAKKIFEVLNLELDLQPTSQASWGAAARRPAYSVLENTMLKLHGLDTLDRWDRMLTEFLQRHGQALIAQELPSSP